jgi:hypothetical protein
MSIVDKKLLSSVFGEQVVTEPTPQIQISSKYGIDPANRDEFEIFEATGGSADNVGNMFRCQTGTSLGGYGVVRTKETAVYREGQGHECRVTASFTTGVALSLQFAGMFSLTETCAFGYDGANFSVIHEYDGKAEVQSYQVTSGATGSESATVTVDGDAFTANLTNSSVQQNAFEIARDGLADVTVSGKWRIEQVDDTVFFISKSVGDKTGTFSFSSSTATATITEEQAGVAKTSGNVAQSSWDNSTPFAGFDPTKLNLYRIEYGYLGAVSIVFSIYNPSTQLFVKVHAIQWANNKTTPVFGNPDFKIGWTSASLGSTGTNLTVQGASGYVGVDGKEVVKNQSYGAENSVASVGTALTNILTIRNRVVYGKQFNLGKIFPALVAVDNDHNKGLIVDIFLNPSVAGVTNYEYEDEFNSIALTEKSGTTVTGGRLVDSFTVPAGGDASISLQSLNIEVFPEDTLVVSAKTVSGTATTVSCGLVWIEEK